MQRLQNLSESIAENNKLEKAQYNLVRVLLWRLEDVHIVEGKDGGEAACHQVLVDCSKKKQFLDCCKTGTVDVADYGKVLGSAWGHETPQSFKDRLDQLVIDIRDKILLVKLKEEGREKIYYVLSDVGRENEIRTASSEEEIKRCGRILYSSNDEDPPESLSHVIEEEYFCLAEHNDIIDSKPFDATRKGELQKVKKYLEEGCDVNSTDKYGWTLMHHAAHCGNMKLIEFLMDKGANVHAQENMCGKKPVHIAAKVGHLGAISFFLKNGASINECDKNNWTPLHYAAWKGDMNVVLFLTQNGALMLAKEASADKKPIHVAAEYGHTYVVQFLLDDANIEDSDKYGRSLLCYATLSGHLQTTKFLIDNGADIYTKTLRRQTLLHAAAISLKEIIEFFLDAGLNIDEEDENGARPLHYASYRGNFNTVKVLVDRGANLFAVCKDGKIPLDDTSNRHTNIVCYFTQKMGKKLQEQEKYRDALKLYKNTLAIVNEKLGPQHPETLEIQNEEGRMLYQLGQYDEAEATFKDILEKRERCSGTNPFDVLCTKHGLGLVYDAQVKYNAAIEILKEVVDKRQTSLGADNNDTLNAFRDLANVHFKKGEYEEAFEMFKDVFEKRNTHFGTDHPKTLQARQDMAVTLINKGNNHKLALQILKDILEKRKNILGNNHPDTLITSYHVSLISKKFEKELKEPGCVIQ